MSKSVQEKNITPAELYACAFQNPEPKHYTRVPNIIDHLTYTVEEKGKKIKKRLSIYAKELYRVIRMIASDGGADWHTTESLAEKINCSAGQVHKAKQELLMPMDQLDGMPLIIEKRKKLQKTAPDGRKFATTLCTRTITDIWRWNNAYMATLKYQNGHTDSHNESVPDTDSCGESAPPGTDSYGEANNIPLKNIPLSKEQHPTADAAPVCLSKEKKGKMSLSDDQFRAFYWMVDNGCDEKSAFYMASKYSSEEISKASQYVNKQFKKNKSKGKQIDNRWGYFRQALKEGYGNK